MPPRQRYVFGYGDPPEWIEEQQADGSWRIFGEGEPPSQLTLQLRRLRAGSARWMRAVGQGGRVGVSLRRADALVSRPSAQAREPGSRGDTMCAEGWFQMLRFALLALGPGARSARASALAALVRDTRVGDEATPVQESHHPHPQPLPTRGRGAHRVCGNSVVTTAARPSRSSAESRQPRRVTRINSRWCSSCAADARRCARPAPARSGSGCGRRWCP